MDTLHVNGWGGAARVLAFWGWYRAIPFPARGKRLSGSVGAMALLGSKEAQAASGSLSRISLEGTTD